MNSFQYLLASSAIGVLALLTSPAAQAQAPTGPAQLTFADHIAPLIYTHCTRCHRTGEVAPFPLTTYTEVQAHAHTIAAVTGSRYMPPWKPAASYRHYLDENTLTDAEIARIRAWVDAGAPQGDPARTPPVPEFPAGSQLGTPDLVVSMPQAFTIPGNNRDLYRVFVLPVSLLADRDISAIEFRAGNKRLVHHAIIGLDTTRQAQALDAAEPGQGYTHFGGFGFDPVETYFGGWTPGQQQRFFPAGMGKKLYHKNAVLLLQVHYGPTATEQTDLSSINIFFARQPVRRYVMSLPAIAPQMLTNGPFIIPAGQVKTFHAVVPVPADATVLSVLPHMHLLGKKTKIWAIKPGGDTIRLAKINDWDFRWQGNYTFLNPLKIPAGSRLEADITYDNTANNWRNPNSPPKAVSWGESTTAEMLLTYFNILPYQPGDENIVLLATQPASPSSATSALRIFPNPATASTTIRFELPRTTSATIRLLDVTGRLVRTLSEAQRRAAGAQQVTIPLTGLAPGEYLVQLETPEFSQAQRLLVR